MNMVEKKIEYDYEVYYLKNKRYKNTKTIHRIGICTVMIPEVSEDEFPVAFEIEEFEDRNCLVRAFNGKLYKKRDASWTPVSKNYDAWRNYDEGDFENGVSVVVSDTKESCKKSIEEAWAFCVKLGNEVWEHSHRVVPFYVVQTFGLGGNHGGTCLSVNWTSQERMFKGDDGFAADDRDAAIRKGVSVAKRRGDTHYIDCMGDGAMIHVRMPELLPPKANLIRRVYSLRRDIVIDGYDDNDFREKLQWELKLHELTEADFSVKSEQMLEKLNDYAIDFVDGNSLKLKKFDCSAADRKDALEKLYDAYGHAFEHRIVNIVENGQLIFEG